MCADVWSELLDGGDKEEREHAGERLQRLGEWIGVAKQDESNHKAIDAAHAARFELFDTLNQIDEVA